MQYSSTSRNIDVSRADYYRVLAAGMSALILTVGLARFAYTPMLPIMAAQAKLSQLAGGWLAAINYGGYMAATLLAAAISDLRKKFVLYRLGLLLAVISTAAMGISTDMGWWALCRFLAGFSSTAGMLLGSGLVLNWLMRHGHRMELGLHFSGLGLGIALSGLLVALSGAHLHWDRQWYFLGLVGVFFFVPAWFWLPAPDGAAKPGGGPAVSTSPPSRRWTGLCLMAYFCAGFSFAMGATFIIAILEKLPMLSGRGGWIWVGVGISAVPSSFLWDRIAKIMGAVPALMLANALQVLSMVLPAISTSAFANIASALIFGGTFAGIVNLTLTVVGRRFPANPAKAMARMTLGYGIAQIIAPALAGYIGKATGNYHGALLLTAVIVAVGMIFLHQLAREEKRPE